MKKKALFPMLALVLVLALAVPLAAPAGADPATGTMTVVSDDSGDTVITKVYNKAGGGNSVVDLSGSPLSVVRAWEPDPYPTTYPPEPSNDPTNSTWDSQTGYFFNGTGADWIWETGLSDDPASYDTSDPLYDDNAARNGRVVLFETTFDIPGIAVSGKLYIAVDNGYEAWVNGTWVGSENVYDSSGPPPVSWEFTQLKEANLSTTGWQTIGDYTIHNISDADPANDLLNSGTNKLEILAGNEYFDTDDGDPAAGTSNNNPGAVIFYIDIEYEANLDVPVDIKPTSCPNPLNVKSKGVLPVAILGTADFDVTTVDVSTVRLEGVVVPLRWALEDVATPYDGTLEVCDDCTTDGPDGFVDLTLKFDKQEVVAALVGVEDGDCVVLHLTGELNDGTPISGEDVVRIIKKGKK